jgi:hypothetical protein
VNGPATWLISKAQVASKVLGSTLRESELFKQVLVRKTSLIGSGLSLCVPSHLRDAHGHSAARPGQLAFGAFLGLRARILCRSSFEGLQYVICTTNFCAVDYFQGMWGIILNAAFENLSYVCCIIYPKMPTCLCYLSCTSFVPVSFILLEARSVITTNSWW